MAETPDFPTCDDRRALLPADPYRSLRVRFGMLLGVDDFETVDAYHRGKTWLHAAWLHRHGAVWGLGASIDPESGEVKVAPGLAIDALGREVHLEQPACLHLGRWYDEHAAEVDAEELAGGGVRFDAHLVARFAGCLTRQVPALVEPCDGAGQTTAYSRVFETVELELVPGPAPDPEAPPFHRLRLLLGLAEPELDEDGVVVAADAEVLAARDEALAAAPAERGPTLLAALRRFAALDTVELAPAVAGEDGERSLFPGAEPVPLVLAGLSGIELAGAEGERTVTAGTVDNSLRPAHVPTSTIQELVCQMLCCSAPEPEPGDGDEAGGGNGEGGVVSGGDEEVAAAAGPAFDPASVRLTARQVVLVAGEPLARASVAAEAFSVTSFDDEEGWSGVELTGVTLGADDRRVTLRFKETPAGPRVRLIARGTGPRPLLGADGRPLGAAPGTPHDGRDFAFMIERS